MEEIAVKQSPWHFWSYSKILNWLRYNSKWSPVVTWAPVGNCDVIGSHVDNLSYMIRSTQSAQKMRNAFSCGNLWSIRYRFPLVPWFLKLSFSFYYVLSGDLWKLNPEWIEMTTTPKGITVDPSFGDFLCMSALSFTNRTWRKSNCPVILSSDHKAHVHNKYRKVKCITAQG